MRMFITGAAGFIGSILVDRALEQGDEVIGVDNFDPFYPEPRKRANLAMASRHPNFRLVELDIRDSARVEAAVLGDRPDAIVHLAARTGVRPSIDEPSLYASTNVVGTTNLLEAARRLDPMPRFVYASSSSVYGDRTAAPFRESDPVQPADQPLRSLQACVRADGPRLPPHPRAERDRSPVLHGLRAEEPSRPGHPHLCSTDRAW